MLRRKYSGKVYFGPYRPSEKEPPADPDKEYKESLGKFKESLERTNESSQDLFEKQLYTIAAGGIGVSLILIDKIVPVATSKLPGLLYYGWLGLVLTILINLISHRVSHDLHYKTIMEIQSGNYCPQKAKTRNIKIGRLNYLTIFFLIGGIILIMSFFTYNLIHMSKEKVVKIEQPSTGTKGLQSGVPVEKPNQTTKK